MSRPTHVLLAVFSSALPVLAQPAPCLDQRYASGGTNGLEVTANQNVVQTFTVGRAGLLAQVDLDDFRLHRGTAQLPFDVQIVTVNAAGVPTNTVRSTTTLPPTAVGASRTVRLDVTASVIFVQPGEVYGIKVATLSPSGGSTYAWGGDAPGGYANGAVFIQDSVGPLSFDLGFKVWVDQGGSVIAYGTGFGGSSGPPTLATSAVPLRGASFDVLCGNPQPIGVPAALLIGVGRVAIPTPLGGTLLVDPLILAHGIQVPASATLAVPISVGSDPTSCGLVVTMQVLSVDATTPAGIAFSAGIELTVGY